MYHNGYFTKFGIGNGARCTRCTNLVKEEEEKIKVLYKKFVHRAPLAKYLFSNSTKKNSRQVPLSFPL